MDVRFRKAGTPPHSLLGHEQGVLGGLKQTTLQCLTESLPGRLSYFLKRLQKKCAISQLSQNHGKGEWTAGILYMEK